MGIIEYIKELFEPLIENPKKVLFQSFQWWFVTPLFIFVLYSFYLIIFGITEEGITHLFLLAIDAGLEWWISAIINIEKAIAEYVFVLLIILHYYYFNS